ncbi:hypothetical protein FRAHR75_130053 [Frankia sp. Hr75.2]|nr:hypothetical protein FRAHR75_130053 [Frankia sp. Hr75.2]
MSPHGVLEGLPAEAVERALWWERHVVEVLRGLPPDSPPGTAPRPDYDPGRWSLTRREQVKAAELAAAGHPVSAATVKRHRQRYQARGVVGLVDHRVDRRRAVFGRLAHGRHVTGSARARRSLVARPDGPFS